LPVYEDLDELLHLVDHIVVPSGGGRMVKKVQAACAGKQSEDSPEWLRIVAVH
jgi:hypothetical protein